MNAVAGVVAPQERSFASSLIGLLKPLGKRRSRLDGELLAQDLASLAPKSSQTFADNLGTLINALTRLQNTMEQQPLSSQPKQTSSEEIEEALEETRAFGLLQLTPRREQLLAKLLLEGDPQSPGTQPIVLVKDFGDQFVKASIELGRENQPIQISARFFENGGSDARVLFDISRNARLYHLITDRFIKD